MEFLESNQMYIVLTIVLIIWFGFIGYLVKLEKQINRIEKQLEK